MNSIQQPWEQDTARGRALNAVLDQCVASLGNEQRDYSPGHDHAIRERLSPLFDTLSAEDLVLVQQLFTSYSPADIRIVSKLLGINHGRSGRLVQRMTIGVQKHHSDEYHPLNRGDVRFIIEASPAIMKFSINGYFLEENLENITTSFVGRFGEDASPEVMVGYGVEQSVRRSFGMQEPYPESHLKWLGSNVDALVPYASLFNQHQSIDRNLCDALLEVSLPLADGAI